MYQPSGFASISESRGAIAGTCRGTDIVPNGTANNKGTWTALGSTTSFAYEAFTVSLFRSAANQYLVDIGFGDGTNFITIAENLVVDNNKVVSEQGVHYYLPLHVPGGVTLYARSQAGSSSSAGVECVIMGHSTGLNGCPGFSRAFSGVSTSLSRGITVDPGATANVPGAWTELIASTPSSCVALMGAVGYAADTARAATARAYVEIGIGAANSESLIYPKALFGWGVTQDGPTNCPRIPVFAAAVPAGSRVAARSQCTINTSGDRLVSVAVYGFVP